MIDLFPLYLSLKVAVTATILTLAAGLPLSYLLARKRFPGRELLDTLVAMPLVLPPTVLGYYLLVALGRQSPIGQMLENWFGVTLVFTWWGAAVAAFVVSLPLLVKSARTAIEEVDPRLEDAARTLGRSEWDVLRTITLPLAWRGIGAGLALAFARALGEFGA
ncbi:MAG: molybdate ABC transporter permease subunit, partial [Nitrospirota bacterium]|nr:molybdate ABC transporter permease subunit [Nitrospirota bacterium]